MSPHDASHEDWLVTRLSGETLPPEIGAKIDACAECRKTLADLKQLEAALDTAGDLERAGTRRAFSAGESSGRKIAPGEDLAAARRSRPRLVPNSPLSPVLRIAAAILVIASIGIAYRSLQHDRHDAGPRLGHTLDWKLEPSGEVSSVTQFSFEARLPSAGSFVVRVYDGLGASRDPILESPPLLEPRWILDPADLKKLPQHFSWEVRMLDATNIEIARSRADVDVVTAR